MAQPRKGWLGLLAHGEMCAAGAEKCGLGGPPDRAVAGYDGAPFPVLALSGGAGRPALPLRSRSVAAAPTIWLTKMRGSCTGVH